ncbi:MAG: alcohol dehydrogenase [Nitrosopumilus sp.]|nr:alcohol dehydrogenase [Nitrosopumilus sp.]
MKSARMPAPKAPLEVVESGTPSPEGEQVLVRVESSGVCHSDLHLWEGGYDMGGGTFMKATDRGVRYPVTPGHEVAGVVEAGGEAGGFSRGDRVLVYPWAGCLGCPGCSSGNENLCDAPRSMGIFQDGGYADHMLVPSHRYLARLDRVDADSATSLACSGLTAYNAVKKAAAASPSHLVVVGAGGLGLMGIQLARELTDAKIICVDNDPAKFETASKMGADHVVDSSSGDPAAAITSICGRAPGAVVDFVNAPPTVGMALKALGKRGTLVLVGLFGGSFELPLVTVPLRSLTIQGAYTGSYAEMAELVSLAENGAIRTVVTKRYGLEEAGAALEDLAARRIVGRAVINP